MITNTDTINEYYTALLSKDCNYDGLFFVGIKTTGVFCHATCPARKPKFENCIFFKTAEASLLAGFRPCKRCHPLSYPKEMSPMVKDLIKLVEDNPEKRWNDTDFEKLGIHSATARRQFKQKFGMTFVQYARSRRMGIALKSIRLGESVINTQIDTGYESASGFYDAFSKIMGRAPSKHKDITMLYAQWLDTPLGSMLSISSDDALVLLEFVDRRGLEREIERLRNRLNAIIIPKENTISNSIRDDLDNYFSGNNLEFKTPIEYIGSTFQMSVWNALRAIPAGTTSTYKDLAKRIGNDKSSRAVGNANGANQLSLIIPCHRIIESNGGLGGYGGGTQRKQWLLDHELKYSK